MLLKASEIRAIEACCNGEDVDWKVSIGNGLARFEVASVATEEQAIELANSIAAWAWGSMFSRGYFRTFDVWGVE